MKQQKQKKEKQEGNHAVVQTQKPSTQRTTYVKGSGEHAFKGLLATAFLGSTGGTVYTVSLNPGDPSIMPRLSTMAQAWTQYKFTKLRLRWVPNGSAFANNNQTGEVVINSSTNWYSASSNTLPMASEKLPATTGNAWETFRLDVPKEILGRLRFVRGNTGGSGADMRLFDILVEVGVFGTPNANICGWLEASGAVEFSGDYTPNLTIAPRTNRVYAVEGLGTQTLVSGAATTISFAGAVMDNSYNSGVTREASFSQFLLAGGTYHIKVRLYLSATTITAANIDIEPTGEAQEIGGAISNIGGSTFSVAALTLTDEVLVTVAEDTLLGSFGVSSTVTGTGTITVAAASLYVTTLG